MNSLETPGVSGLAPALGPFRDLPHDLQLVQVIADGASWTAGFVLDKSEHYRRVSAGGGPVVDRRALHALWELPTGEWIGASALNRRDVETLEACNESLVEQDGRHFRRLFRPAGRVRLAICAASRLERGLWRMSRLPPIFYRFVTSTSESLSERAIELAHRRGVGVISPGIEGSDVLVPARPPLRGCPAVYRWWIDELAYEGWLSTTEPIS